MLRACSVIEYENIVKAAARIYYWPGAEIEDVEQEARLSLLRWKPKSPALAKVVVHRHLIEQVRRETRRRVQFTDAGMLNNFPNPRGYEDVVDQVSAREQLRRISRIPFSPVEREALSRAAQGIGCVEKRLDNALHRARRKLRAAA
jgi:DNA-directed RNA polymerase specialized sigma24 family protein